MADLYESVQHAAHIIPRIYLLITVGSAYIKSKEATPSEILTDLIDMVKGVQQPTRGLFLRFYLLKMMKDLLPDKDSGFESEGNNVESAVTFILRNLSEMNRLWIRLQYLNSKKDKTGREAEREELRVTVGENISRLSMLEGIDEHLYSSVVLPKLLETIVTCKDTMSQQYLMECVIQAFPDEFHLKTLEPLLEATTKLNPEVEIKQIFISLMERLSKFAKDKDILTINKNINIFELFKKYTDKIIEEQGRSIELSRLLELEVAFLNFSIRTYPEEINYVNLILESTTYLIKSN
jgi:vacuolar protein sorting-associated protein 35